MAFAADFLGGLNAGLGRGIDMYGQLQQMAQQQKMMELRSQTEQRVAEAQQAQAQQSKVNALINVAKLKKDARGPVLQMLAPALGFDPADPSIQALIEGIGSGGEEFLKNLQIAGSEFGLSPAQTGVLAEADPNVAVQQLFGFNRQSNSNELAQLRLMMQQQGMEMRGAQADLSRQRLEDQQYRFQQRLAGNIPPMGYQPQLSEQGDLRSLAAVPGGPATVPTEGERKSASQYTTARGSLERGMAFLQSNPEYLNTNRAQLDATLATDATKLTAGVGTALGGALGGVAGAAARHPYTGAMAGAASGGALGAGVSGFVERMLTSDEGKTFKAAWTPFINAVLRRETGATVTATEWADAFGRFVPQPGDPPETLAMKEQNRNEALEAIRVGADRAAPPGSKTPPAPAMGRTQIQALGAKYKAGQATPEEISQLKAALRAQGLNVK